MNRKEKRIAEGMNRSSVILKTGIIGIAVNILLAGAKAIIGWMTSSLAVMLDGINNLTDAGSSLVTLISAKLARKEADKKHPYGYGRTEYLSTLIIAMIILYAGISSFSESIQKLIHGGLPDYTPLTLWILFFAILVKIGLGLYTISMGKRADSGPLEASGRDALNDSVMTGAVLISALIYQFSGISLEAWISLIISLFIIKSGIDITREALSKIIGERTDPELAEKVRQEIVQIPGVTGAYDLYFNDYGPEKKIASVHIEVPDTWSAARVDETSRLIEQNVYHNEKVTLSAVGIYVRNTRDPEIRNIENRIHEILNQFPHILQMHGFYADEKRKQIRFDLIIDYNVKNRRSEYEEILAACRKEFPDYNVQITLDADISE